MFTVALALSRETSTVKIRPVPRLAKLEVSTEAIYHDPVNPEDDFGDIILNERNRVNDVSTSANVDVDIVYAITFV